VRVWFVSSVWFCCCQGKVVQQQGACLIAPMMSPGDAVHLAIHKHNQHDDGGHHQYVKPHPDEKVYTSTCNYGSIHIHLNPDVSIHIRQRCFGHDHTLHTQPHYTHNEGGGGSSGMLPFVKVGARQTSRSPPAAAADSC
jgi:hypothetical protein